MYFKPMAKLNFRIIILGYDGVSKPTPPPSPLFSSPRVFPMLKIYKLS